MDEDVDWRGCGRRGGGDVFAVFSFSEEPFEPASSSLSVAYSREASDSARSDTTSSSSYESIPEPLVRFFGPSSSTLALCLEVLVFLLSVACTSRIWAPVGLSAPFESLRRLLARAVLLLVNSCFSESYPDCESAASESECRSRYVFLVEGISWNNPSAARCGEIGRVCYMY